MAYFMLYARDDGLWSPQFGDFTRADVDQERRDSYQRERGHAYEGDGKYAAKDLKIIRFDSIPSQADALIMGAKLAEPEAT